MNPFFFYDDPEGVLAVLDGMEEGRAIAESLPHDFLRHLLKAACTHGFEGNLWHCYLAYQLMMQENPFSLCCERHGLSPKATMNQFAQRDLGLFRKGFLLPFAAPESLAGHLEQYHLGEPAPQTEVGRQVNQFALALRQAADLDEFICVVARRYQRHGVGMLGVNRGFRLDEQNRLAPIANLDAIRLDDLVGYERQKQELKANTEAFLKRRPANNVLLFGESGTGKSSSIKALVNDYYSEGLRMIELHKHQFSALPAVIAQIKERAFRFIVFVDDLSFDEGELEYKYLKSVIEGGLETRPENVLIYATSNRRHLIKETWRDRADMEHDGDIHRSETVEEKLSLAERFGISIYYGNPTPQEYRSLIQVLAERKGLKLTKEQLEVDSGAWEIRHGGVSCRTAQQYVDFLSASV